MNSFEKVKWLSKLDKECRTYRIKMYSDSSSFADAAFIENQNEMVNHRMFSDFEITQSSTARELMALNLAVNSFCKEFTNRKRQFAVILKTLSAS